MKDMLFSPKHSKNERIDAAAKKRKDLFSGVIEQIQAEDNKSIKIEKEHSKSKER